MPWFRFDDQAAFSAKIVAAGNEAVGAWARAGAWSSGELTDGFVPRDVALTIAPKRVWDRLRDARAGHEHGLVEERDDGWQIHNFTRRNPTAESIRTEREATKKRVGNWRTKRVGNAVTNGVSTPDVQVPHTHSHRSPQPPKGGSGKRSGPTAEQRYRAAYEAGIGDGAPGERFALPAAKISGLLGPVLAKHAAIDGLPLEGASLDDWIRQTVAEWRRSGDPFASGWTPHRFVAWLNGGRQQAIGGRTAPSKPARPIATEAPADTNARALAEFNRKAGLDA